MMRISFNIFDGTPDQDSTWARFIDPQEYEDADSMIQEDTVSDNAGHFDLS